MWTHPLTIAFVAVGSSLLTIFLTPWLHHHFWRYQARDELRLAAIKEFNRLTADFIAGVLFDRMSYSPNKEWFAALNTAGGEIQVLFSKEAFMAVQAVDKMIRPGLGPLGNKSTDEFVEARDAALRALYREVIPLPR